MNRDRLKPICVLRILVGEVAALRGFEPRSWCWSWEVARRGRRLLRVEDVAHRGRSGRVQVIGPLIELLSNRTSVS